MMQRRGQAKPIGALFLQFFRKRAERKKILRHFSG